MISSFGSHVRRNLIAYAALFFALGGTSFAAVQALPRNSVGTKQLKNNAVISSKVKNNTLTGADINEARLGKVPSARRADNATHATAADSATNATNASNATNATNATNAANAAALGGKPASDYAQVGAEAVRVIGAPGQAAFGAGWGFGGIPTEEVPGYWKDPAGTVHLRGAAGRLSGTGTLMFTLPTGYRPKLQQWFITYGAALTQAYVSVNANGDVVYQGGRNDAGPVNNSNYIGLGNITFRADQ
jgi:hypothetical protein